MKYIDYANKAVTSDILRRRKNVLKKNKKKYHSMRKKEHLLNNRIKRSILKAQTDANLLNKSHNSFIGIYITFGHHMSRFLSLKPDQHILIAHLGVPPSEDFNMYLKLRPNLKKKRLRGVLFILISYLQKYGSGII